MLLRNIFKRKGRTFMTILAIAVSSALLISMLSIGEGIRRTAYLSVEEGKEDIVVSTTISYISFAVGGITQGHKISEDIKETMKNESAVAETSPLLFSPLLINTEDNLYENGTQILVAGTIPMRDKNFFIKEDNKYRRSIYGIGVTFYEGEMLEGGDEHFADGNYNGNFTGEIVIDRKIATQYNLSKNSTVYLSSAIKDNSTNSSFYEFKIVGIFDTDIDVGGAVGQQLKGFAHIRLSELQTILGERYSNGNDTVSQILISLNEYKRNEPKFVKRFAETLKEKYPKYQILTKADRLKQLDRDISLTNTFNIAIGMVSLIIGLLFVACVMIMAVSERTNEIGMLRAIGISRETIFSQIFLESMIIVIMGAFVGLIPGYYGSIVLSNYLAEGYGITREFYAFTPLMALYTLILLIGTGSFVSLYPAYRAVKMDIIKALKRVK